jgi:argininosuccinate lyase
MQTKKLWSGRFTKQTDPAVDEYTASINFDQEFAAEDILGSMAHAAMLEHCGILSAAEAAQLRQGLQQIAKKIAAGDVTFRLQDEDIHMNIERMLHESIGAVAGKLHTARSRNDQSVLDTHLYLRKKLVVIVDLLLTLQETLLQIAEAHRTTILPGYTHLQRAQPIYFAQHLLAYAAMLQRDVARLQDLWPRVNQSPLGACALTGTTFPTDRYYTAQILSFDGIYLNTLDAVSDRDFIIEFLSAASLIMLHISRLSEELILWASQEFNFITLDDAFCTGSSIMPQKKNPDVVEVGRGKSGRVYGALFTVLTVAKGLPLTYNKDLQEDKEPLFDTIKTVQQTLAIYAPMLATMQVNVDNMRSAVDQGYLNATVLAEYLVQQGLAFRAAHEVVGKMVAHCVQKKCKLEDLSLTDMQQFSAVIKDDVYQILAVEHAVAACNQRHGKSLLEVEFSVQKQMLQTNNQWLVEKDKLLQDVYHKFSIVKE